MISVVLITSILLSNNGGKRTTYLADKESRLEIIKIDLQNLSDSMTLKPTKENWDLYEIQCIQIRELEKEITNLKNFNY